MDNENLGAAAPQKRRRRGLVDAIIFLVGLGIFLYPLVLNYIDHRHQSAAIDAYQQAVEKLTPAQTAKMWTDATTYNNQLGSPKLRDPFLYTSVQPPLDRYYQTLNVDGKGLMAYIDYPKIRLKIPVYHGTSDQTLLKGAGHITTTQLPTTQLSIHPVFTGHTGEIGHIFFDNLTQAAKGDVFTIRVLDKNLSYKVDDITIINPHDMSQLQPTTGKNYVTLVTCWPYMVNSERLLVRAEFIGLDVPPTQPTGAPLWFMWLLLGALLAAALALMWVRRRRATLRAMPAGETPWRRIRQLTAVAWILGVVILILVWGSFGLMMRTGFLPTFNLGYHWFDTHIFYFFGIAKPL